MLSWLTGAKGSEDASLAHCESFIEAPETPAPVFAVRAFKHAIFGTPKPLDPNDQNRMIDIATTMKAKTSNAAIPELAAVSREEHDFGKNMTLFDDLNLSPSKPNGILMTPGTTRRNKTVTFGAHVVDNEGKKGSKSGLPTTCPGKFPSPWTPKTHVDGLSEITTSSQKRTKLTQTLHDVRDSSKSSKSNRTTEKVVAKSKDDLDITLDFKDPRSQSGRYWKQEYEAYAEKTQREVKKLLIKQKSAKEFARAKDAELLDLVEKLRQETRKAETLEARSKQLEQDMRELKKKLEQENGGRPLDDLTSAQNEAARLRLENWKLREDLGRAQGKPPSAQTSPRRRPVATANADIWADAAPSSPFVADPVSPARVFVPTANPSPLRTRDINTLDASAPKHSKPHKPYNPPVRAPIDHRSPTKPTPRSSRNSQLLAEDTLELSLALPQPSPDMVRQSPPQSTKRTPRSARRTPAKNIDDLLERYSPSKSIMMSSPADFDRMALPIGMPSISAASRSTHAQMHRKKPSLMESFTKVVSPGPEKTPVAMKDSVSPMIDCEVAGSGQNEAEEDRAKKQIGEERKRAAMDRLAAKRARRSKAA